MSSSSMPRVGSAVLSQLQIHPHHSLDNLICDFGFFISKEDIGWIGLEGSLGTRPIAIVILQENFGELPTA